MKGFSRSELRREICRYLIRKLRRQAFNQNVEFEPTSVVKRHAVLDDTWVLGVRWFQDGVCPNLCKCVF